MGSTIEVTCCLRLPGSAQPETDPRRLLEDIVSEADAGVVLQVDADEVKGNRRQDWATHVIVVNASGSGTSWAASPICS